MLLRCKNRSLSLDQPLVMGIINVTPDSFSDGGQCLDPIAAEARARQMIEDGASLIDVGGESTRPGAQPVSESDELTRTLPVIERIAGLGAVISIDTSKPRVMREACSAGAGLINDVYALRQPGAMEVAVESGAAVCLMHMQGEPRVMQDNPHYEDVVGEVRDFLAERVKACKSSGMALDRLLLDPGFGFGKRLEHNLMLMARLTEFLGLGCPLLVGVSRKSMLGAISGLPVLQRIHPGLAAAVLAVWQGARIVRTHDVKATVEALKLVAAVMPHQAGKTE